MEIAKNIFVVVVLGAVCYGVYVSLSTDPHGGPSPSDNEEWAGGEVGHDHLGSPPGEEVSSSVAIDPFRKKTEVETISTVAAGPHVPAPAAANVESHGDSNTPRSDVRPVPPAATTIGESGHTDGDPSMDSLGRPYPDTNYPAISPANPSATGKSAAGGDVDPSGASSMVGESSMWTEMISSVDPALSSNNLVEALAGLSRWYGDPRLSPTDQERLVRMLDQLACTTIYYRDHHMEPPYVVQSGETLEDIARRYQVPWQLLANINGILDPRALQPGETLKVVRGPFSAQVVLRDQELTLMLGELYAGRFPIHTNPNDTIVEGRYQVRLKADAPPRTIVFPAQASGRAPLPPSGWLGLTGVFGLHGGYSEGGGSQPLPGCIQLSDQDIADLRAILSENSVVVIRR